MHPVIEKVTQDIVDRSHKTRSAYLNYIDAIAKKALSVQEWVAVI
jgi:hypothetical protein